MEALWLKEGDRAQSKNNESTVESVMQSWHGGGGTCKRLQPTCKNRGGKKNYFLCGLKKKVYKHESDTDRFDSVKGVQKQKWSGISKGENALPGL